MSRHVHCLFLKKEAEGLDFAPFPSELGKKIFENISKEAWKQWLARQTILINEYRLSTLEPQAREFLRTEMQKFLFENGGEALPGAYTPPKQ